MVKTVTSIERERVTREGIGLGDFPPPKNGSNGNGSRGNGGGGGGDGGDDRARHAHHKARIAMWVALCSILMLFTALASAYIFLVAGKEGLRPVRMPPLLWLSTALIIASSLTLKRAIRSLKQGSERGYSRWLLLTVALGLSFLGSQLFVWRQLVAQGVYLAGNPHSTFFYLLTGIHGAHLLGGIVALDYLLLRARRRNRTVATRETDARRRTAADVIALYWHFMDGLWVSLFLLLLIWR
ncbi:MAG: cytochrome c oxidase subunit 3 [Pyrinomonadaceae bacterium]